jgi:hypothetical protein
VKDLLVGRSGREPASLPLATDTWYLLARAALCFKLPPDDLKELSPALRLQVCNGERVRLSIPLHQLLVVFPLPLVNDGLPLVREGVPLVPAGDEDFGHRGGGWKSTSEPPVSGSSWTQEALAITASNSSTVSSND